ncbi:MAG: hypothetical protein AVDCRST_MAG56-2805 [uncultured Cytophagales bacterium]|uniref:Uncharacterized protein n=1 Tax=uncultured Cytophagales bacterium TaxID=158755 RepID=A0A6J4J2N0_9SPHI|nr:MAG: hypothetical protein AVDCRST_MAG56-2805 [uncultured Cytophagales bacterium]
MQNLVLPFPVVPSSMSWDVAVLSYAPIQKISFVHGRRGIQRKREAKLSFARKRG